MGSHSVTRHPTQVNAPRLNASQIGRYLVYLPHKGWKAELALVLVVTDVGMIYLSADSHPS